MDKRAQRTPTVITQNPVDRACVVMKFGGSSVATVERIRQIAARLVERHRTGAGVVAVVSAMGNTTNDLLALAAQVAADPPRRELDMLLSVGERITMALLSAAIHELGEHAVSLTGSQVGILTTDEHANARIVDVRPFRIQDELRRSHLVIVAGFQGTSYKREITTLGRGGSDTTAVALAAALGADCEIYSDVAGVFSADPRVVVDAVKLDAISYEEMQQLSQQGAKVLNAQAVEFARRRQIAVYARSTFGSTEQTVIQIVGSSADAERAAAGFWARGVTSSTLRLLVSCAAAGDADGGFDALWSLIAPAGVVSVRSDSTGLLVLLDTENVHDRPGLVARLRSGLPDAAVVDDAVATVSVVGSGTGANPLAVGAAVELLRASAVAVRHLLVTPDVITVVVARSDAQTAVRLLHQRFVGTGL